MPTPESRALSKDRRGEGSRPPENSLSVLAKAMAKVKSPTTRLPSASARAACSVAGSTRMVPRCPMSDQETRAQCESSAHCSAGAAPSAPPRSTMLHSRTATGT